MLELLAFAGLLIAGVAFMAVMGVVFLLVRLSFWLVFLPFRLIFLPIKLLFLPFRLLFKLIWLPVGLIGGMFSLAAGVAIVPILLTIGGVIAAVAAIAALLALLVPAIPFVLLGLMIWAIMRRSPVAAS